MKRTILAISLTLCTIGAQIGAQSAKKDKNKLGPNDFPELINADIPGAPKLGKPQLIMGATGPVKGEGAGWAAPAVYDWDGDGKKDLLIGEFGSGATYNKYLGHYIRVYKNIGTDESPRFSDDFEYARGTNKSHGEATTTDSPLSIHLWCCMAFVPRFADLDNDGFEDLLAGQYDPGYVNWFRGSGDGFLPGVRLREVYSPELKETTPEAYKRPSTDPVSPNYWMYSSVAFGDFDGDGDQDMVVGGHGIRMAKNIGTKTDPLFGKRELLLDTNGEPLKVIGLSEEFINKHYGPGSFGIPATSGAVMNVPYVVDWDQDGVLDLFVTAILAGEEPGSTRDAAVTYFRGVKTKEGMRFEPGIPLFSTRDGSKEFPGSWPNVYVTDWNNDGVNDLIIGTSVATLDGGKFSHELSWKWEFDTGIFKQNHALTYDRYKKMVDDSKKRYEESLKKKGLSSREIKEQLSKWKPGIKGFRYDEPYKTLIHQGYVYVMLGEKR